MTKLILHAKTEAAIDNFVLRPSHTLLITGPHGIGKGSLAKLVAEKILHEPIETYAFVTRVVPDDGTISIEAIRELRHVLRLKLPSHAVGIRRFVIIENAETMTPEAQNALLKLLEEPPADTLLLLTATDRQDLLATIISRLQHVAVLPPAKAQLLEHFAATNSELEQMYWLSGGLPGLLTSLVADSSGHELVAAAKTAREILAATPLTRLTMIDTLAKTPEAITQILTIVQQMAHIALANAAQKSQPIAKWQKVQKAAYEAKLALKANSNSKLTLLNFMLQI